VRTTVSDRFDGHENGIVGDLYERQYLSKMIIKRINWL
jgi:hypothetical protein